MPVHAKTILPLRAKREIEDAEMHYTRGACVKANSKRNFSEHLYHARECRRFQQVGGGRDYIHTSLKCVFCKSRQARPQKCKWKK